MDKLTIEQKAKAYDEALERAKGVIEQNPLMEYLKKGIEYIFPELKESEDEIVIAALKSGINGLLKKEYHLKGIGGISFDRIITWLEKQCEQKQVAIPKFKVGDWVVFNNKHQSIYQVDKIEDGYYILRHTHGGTFRVCVLHDESLRLWTIQDAKDGDVLHASSFSSDCIFIFARLDKWKFDESNGEKAVATGHCCLTLSAYNMEFGIQGPDCIEIDTVKPATKIQRDLLEKAMSDAGYTFDFDKKELKDGEQKPNNVVWHKVQPKEYVLEKTLIIKKNGEFDMVSDTILSVTDAEYALPVSQLPNPKSNMIQGEQKPYGLREECKDCQCNYAGECNGSCGCFWKDGNEQPKVVKAEDIKYWMPVPSLDVQEEPKKYMYSKDNYTDEDRKVLCEGCGEDCKFKQKAAESPTFKDKLLELFQKFRYIKDDVPTNGDIIDYVDTHIQELIDTIQKPVEWSEEDEKMFSQISDILWEGYKNTTGEMPTWDNIREWCLSIKNRVQPQPKKEWSEEDEQLYNDLSDTYYYNDKDYPEETYKLMLKRVLDWMDKRAKSLRHQSTWKPSDEQMKVLVWCKPLFAEPESKGILESLINDLKKLREE